MTVAAHDATAEQRAVIELPADARAFVVAGPGAGKTWTLLRRAALLVERDGIQPSDLLVLSFTRAVVRELRRRDREVHAFPTIFPETFDAFATRLLGQHATDDRWRTRGYEGRIQAAADLVRAGRAADTLKRVAHVLVDEVQDLVGVRSEFVAALLEAHPGGFTAFGDPAQAIYDHEGDGGGDTLIPQLEDGLADSVLSLSGNHRAGGELAESVEAIRQALLSGRVQRGVDAADDAFAEIESLGDFEQLPVMLRTVTGEVAVLCRDNATALLLSRALHEAGIVHRVRRGTSDRPVAGWVAPVFDGSTALDRRRLAPRLDALAEVGFPAVPDPEVAWRSLSKLDRQARSGAVRASEVRSHIAVGRVPYELYDEPSHSLIVSSIHRAKGLEFDRCAIVGWPSHDDADEALEARILFVALSRAREEPLHVGARKRNRQPWFRNDKAAGRFIKRGRQDWQTFGIEIRGDDVHGPDPAGRLLLDASPVEVQERLVREVRPGDPVHLEEAGQHDFGYGRRRVYAVLHAAGPIGVTGSSFGDALRGRLGEKGPHRIRDVRVDDLETVTGSTVTSEAAGLGRAGMWLRPRLVGLGEFDWNAE